MNIERIPLASLSLDPANARKHDQRSVDSIKASLRRWGQQKPVVVDGKGIVRAGNGMLIAAKELGWKEIDIVRSELVGSEMTAYSVADNRCSDLSSWMPEVVDIVSSVKLELPDLPLELAFDDIAADLNVFDVSEGSMPDLPDGGKGDVTNITFSLTSEQNEIVEKALAKAKKAVKDEASNVNGLALTTISEAYLKE